MKELSLKELRKLYPNIKDNSKEGFLAKVDALEAEVIETEVVAEEVVAEAVTEEKVDLVKYLLDNAKSKKKVLVQLETSLDADEAFLTLRYELFPVLNKEGISVVASESRRDISINGSFYVRLSCKKNFNHFKGLVKYTDFKQI